VNTVPTDATLEAPTSIGRKFSEALDTAHRTSENPEILRLDLDAVVAPLRRAFPAIRKTEKFTSETQKLRNLLKLRT
jgi:hypothetical protein